MTLSRVSVCSRYRELNLKEMWEKKKVAPLEQGQPFVVEAETRLGVFREADHRKGSLILRPNLQGCVEVYGTADQVPFEADLGFNVLAPVSDDLARTASERVELGSRRGFNVPLGDG